MSRTLAVIVQRYGIEVNGGAEYHARLLVEKLSGQYRIEVLTTMAIDYGTWENYYAEGVEEINNIQVRRFPTINVQSGKKTRIARRALCKERKYFRILKMMGLFNFFDRKFNITEVKPQEVENWIIGQGPYCPELISFIKANQDCYDAFIFFTYLYYPTFKGMPIVADKSILIPTAHHEPLLFADVYQRLFSVPRFIMYNTESEKKLIENNFENYTKDCDVAGVGIDRYTGEEEPLPDYVEARNYFIYIGRIDRDKGCEQLLKYFVAFQNRFPAYKQYKLVLVGKNYMTDVYKHPTVVYTGFVSEALKYTLLRNARTMIMPSFYESLSLVTLEAMSEKIPVIVNRTCEVLYEHIRRSDTGAAYSSFESFCSILEAYIQKSDSTLENEGEKAENYVSEHYTWQSVLDKFDRSIDFVINN